MFSHPKIFGELGWTKRHASLFQGWLVEIQGSLIL
jgi:hypothetical protein